MYGIQLLLGSEVNILDAAGTVDLEQKTLEKLDVVIASLHVPCIRPGSRQENTEAYLNAMKNPCVNIIGHPDDGRYDIDYEALVQGAREYGKVLELNNHSMNLIIKGKHKKTLIFPVFSGNSVFYSDSCLVVV